MHGIALIPKILFIFYTPLIQGFLRGTIFLKSKWYTIWNRLYTVRWMWTTEWQIQMAVSKKTLFRSQSELHLKNNFTVLKKCSRKFDCLLYKMLIIRKRNQTYQQILRAKVFVWDYTFVIDRKSTRLNSSHANISYAVFCLKKKKQKNKQAIK